MLEWNKLSIKDKSAIMKMALLAGFTNINDIKELYNLYALGGMMNTNNPLPNFLGGRLPIPAVRYDEGGHLFKDGGLKDYSKAAGYRYVIKNGDDLNPVIVDKNNKEVAHNASINLPEAQVVAHRSPSLSDIFESGMTNTMGKPWEAALILAARGPEYYGENSVYNMTPDTLTMNAVTGGAFNYTSPTLLIGNAVNVILAFRGKKDWKDVRNELVYGNSGAVSDNFALEHPYLTMGINGLVDGAVIGGIERYSRGPMLIPKRVEMQAPNIRTIEGLPIKLDVTTNKGFGFKNPSDLDFLRNNQKFKVTDINEHKLIPYYLDDVQVIGHFLPNKEFKPIKYYNEVVTPLIDKFYGNPYRAPRAGIHFNTSALLGNSPNNNLFKGFHTSDGENFILKNSTPKEFLLTYTHEGISHGTDDMIPEVLEKYRGILPTKERLEAAGVGFKHNESYNPWELRATVNERRLDGWDHTKYKELLPNGEETIKHNYDSNSWDKISNPDLMESLVINGYGEDYNNLYLNLVKMDPELAKHAVGFTADEFANSIRYALKKLPAVAPITTAVGGAALGSSTIGSNNQKAYGGHLFDGSGNSKIHTASTIELALNRLKQEFLRSRGINVNVDGSWGSWLELLYRNLLAYKPSSSKTLLSLFYNNAARGNLYKTAAVRNAEDRTRRASKPFDARAYVNLGLVLLLDNTRHTPGEAKSTTSAYLLALLERKNELDLRAKWELEMKRVYGSSYLGNGKMLNPNYPTIYDKVNMTRYPLSYLALLSSFSPSYNQDISQELKEFLATKDKTLYGMALTLEPLLTYIPGNPMSGGALMAHANTDAMTMSAVADLPSIATSFIEAPIETAFGLGAGIAGSYYGGNYAADKWGEKARTAGELLGGIGFGTAAGLGARAARGVYNFGRDKYLGYTVASDINRGVKNFDNTVGESYFYAPDKTYRVTETPEAGTIIETGKNFPNVATNANSSNNMRYIRAIHSYNTSHASQGLKLINTKDLGLTLVKISPDQKTIGLHQKVGSAHGGLSLASLGLIWTGGFSKSGNFPNGVLEINTPTIVRAAYDRTRGKALTRTDFELGPSEGLPIGTRIGFDTGEMPTEGLTFFRNLGNGRYNREPVNIPRRVLAEYPLNPNLSITKDSQTLFTPEPSYTKEVPMIDKAPTGEVSEPSLVTIPTASTTPTNNIFTKIRDRFITPTNPILTDTPLSLREARLYLVRLRGAKNRDEIDNIFTELRDRLITTNENIIPTLFKASKLHINTKVGYASEIAKQTLIPDQINNSYEVLRNNGLYPVTKKELELFRKNELDLVNNTIELVRNDFLNNKLKLWDKRLDLWGAANEKDINDIKLSLLNRMSPLQLPIYLLPKKEYETKRGKTSIGQYQPVDNEVYVKKLDMKKSYEPWINTLYHELNHAYDFNFYNAFSEKWINLERLARVLYKNRYYENNPYSPLWREFEKSPNIVRNRGSWGGSPEEMTSEATNYTFKHSKNGKTVPYKELSDKLKRRVIEDLSTRFKISIQDAKDILETMSKSGLVLNDTKSTNLLLYNTPTFYELLYTT